MSIPAPAAWGARQWQANASAPSLGKRLAVPSNQVTARYVEVDGKPYVMEMILPLDASARSTLHSNELIYRDALTGAYNRRFMKRN